MFGFLRGIGRAYEPNLDEIDKQLKALKRGETISDRLKKIRSQEVCHSVRHVV